MHLFYLHRMTHIDIDREDFDAARKLWKDTHDPEAALAIFPKKAYSERKLLHFYVRNPESHAKAIKSVSCTLFHAKKKKL